MRRFSFSFPKIFLLLAPCFFLAIRAVPVGSATFEQYCQYPPYVFQSVLPSVTLLVSNSQSMGKFAYGDPAHSCALTTDACGGFVSTKTYFGIFDADSWYTNAGSNSASGSRFSLHGKKSEVSKGSNDWDGNFLNWLTTRRIDVMKKVLTGGDGTGSEACGSVTERYKTFSDNQAYTPFNVTDNVASFSIAGACNGASTSIMTFPASGGSLKNYKIEIQSVGSTSGIIQEMTPKASLGLSFYNDSDSQGGNLDPQIDGSNLPISAYRNRIDTPSRFNGMTVGAPLGEALWTIVGSYAMLGDSASSTGPRYHGTSDYNANKDPFFFHGAPSRCIKGSVIVISDGEPCKDGSLPTSYSGSNILHYANGTPLNCQGDTCQASASFDFPQTSIPSCSAGDYTAGFEDVALFAHTNDVRGSSFGVNNIENMQNLDIYVIRAFGSDNSNLLKYGAINGSFDLSAGDNTAGRLVPTPGSYSLDDIYIQADDGFAIQAALERIFENLLRRATSGTAASVLASGQGSGANLIQAVFYPRRRFLDEVIEWTGTLQNFWYYIDPFFGGSSVREESETALPNALNLVNDNTITFFFDPTSQTTKVNEFRNDSTTGNATGTASVIPFEYARSIWESGKFLHIENPADRTIFTVVDNNYGTSFTGGNPFLDSNSSLYSYLNAGTNDNAMKVINYVRGQDDLANFRQRTVPYPPNFPIDNVITYPTDNTTWKLGDIINSTPRVVSSIALNTYDKTYSDTTYTAFTNTTVYQNRGMVFVGANDGMLHAFKLGKLEFPTAGLWPDSSAARTWDKARLRNLDTSTGGLGSERWAFIPKNALPYLQAMLDNNYCHLYYVDLAPQIFDASITGADNAVRTVSSWKTILIGGMRLGGGCASPSSGRANAVDIPMSGVGYSSYFAIDVTDPESPSVLWEFSDPSLGFTTTGPSVIRINANNGSGNPDRTLNGKWVVVFGSGPTGPITGRQFLGNSDQNLKLFVVDLKNGNLLRTIDRFSGNTIPKAFAGSMINSTADFNLDYTDDAAYIGYVKAQTSGGTDTWNQGGIVRLQTKGSMNPNDWEASVFIDNIGPVTSSVVRLQSNTLHTNWVYFGTGRYFYASASGTDDPTVQRRLFGVKDPCFTIVNTMDNSCTTTVPLGDLTQADTPPTTEPARGWYINLDTASPVNYDNTVGSAAKSYKTERVITDPLAISAGVVFFTTYRPYGDDCAIGGRSFLWAVKYNTGGAPAALLQGRALMQVSTASIEQVNLSTAFTDRGGRRSASMEGVPPTAQGLSLLTQPPPVKRIMHMKER